MISDCQPDKEVKSGSQISLSLNFDDIESINKIFRNLSVGGNVTMELQDTFWGARFGMTKDKFGVHWIFNHNYKKEE